MPNREAREHLDRLIKAAIAAGDPAAALSKAWPRVGGLVGEGPVHVFATGKASVELAAAAVGLLEDRLVNGFVTAVPERASRLTDARFRVVAADHPLPTERNVEAARAALDFVSSVPEDATLLVLISGGGSAHLTLPAGDITLADMRTITTALQNAGTTVEELNAVRKHIERLKGGQLAAATKAGRVVSLVMSDVQNDRLDVISSGPTAPDPSTYADALGILERHRLLEISPRVTQHLRDGAAGKHKETLKPGDKSLSRVTHRVIASNLTAKDAVAETARRMGYFVSRDHRFISGGAAAEGRRLGGAMRRLALSNQRTCFIAGGEPVVNVEGTKGWGGPSQELALAAAIELDDAEGVLLAAISTDGVDGPPAADSTTHAGAIVTGETAQDARTAGVDPLAALSSHDSGTFFKRAGGALSTGPTGTNINHLAIGLLVPPKR